MADIHHANMSNPWEGSSFRCESRQIFFRYLDGTNMVLDLHGNTCMSDVKEMLIHKAHHAASSCTLPSTATAAPKILEKEEKQSWGALLTLVGWLAQYFALSRNTKARDLYLTCNGKLLEDTRTVADYGPLTTVQVSARVQGGCFMLSATVLGTIILACIASTCTCGLSLVVVPFLLPLLFILPLFCL